MTAKKGGKILAALAFPALLAVSAAAQEGPTIGGFVDFGYSWNFNEPVRAGGSSGFNTLRVFDTLNNNFTLHNAELNFAGEVEGVGAYRVDLNFGHDAALIHSAGFTSAAALQADLQQAYMSFPCMLTNGTWTAGKWVTLLGKEVIESPDNLNYSRSILFGYTIPFTHTGIKYDYSVGDQLNLTGGIVNGWDNLTDNNSSKSLIAGVGYNPAETLSFYLSGIYGAEQAQPAVGAPATQGNQRGVVTLVTNFTASDKLSLSADLVYGSEDGASAINAGDNAVWRGAALYGTYAFTDKYSATLRYENVHDRDGSRLGLAPQSATVATLGALVLNEYTLTLQRKNENFLQRIELRQDMANRAPFVDDKGMAEDTQMTLGLEIAYTF